MVENADLREPRFDRTATGEDRFGGLLIDVQRFVAVDGGTAEDDDVAVRVDAQQIGRHAGVF